MWSWQGSLPCINNLVGCGMAVPPSGESDRRDVFTGIPGLGAHCKLQHQEAVARWPLHMDDLGWGLWPASAEEGLSFLIYSEAHGWYTLTHCTDLSKGGTWVPTPTLLSHLPFRFPITLLPRRNDSYLSWRFPLTHPSAASPPPLVLTSPRTKGLSAHKGTDNARFCLSKVGKLAPSLSVHWLPPRYYWPIFTLLSNHSNHLFPSPWWY